MLNRVDLIGLPVVLSTGPHQATRSLDDLHIASQTLASKCRTKIVLAPKIEHRCDQAIGHIPKDSRRHNNGE